MSKVTVITDSTDLSKVVAIGHGHLSESSVRKDPKAQGLRAGLRAGPNQKLTELDVPNDVSRVQNFDELIKHVQPHLK